MGERWRLVTIQNGRRYISSVVLTEDEARDLIVAEGVMHEQTGWRVEWGLGQISALSKNGRVVRTVTASRFTAMADILS